MQTMFAKDVLKCLRYSSRSHVLAAAASSTCTDEQGRFLLSGLRDAEYMLRVMNNEENAWWTSGAVRARTRDALLTLPSDLVRDEVTGRVVDRSGRPVAGAVLTPMLCVAVTNPGSYSAGDGPTFRTDEEGASPDASSPAMGSTSR